MKQRLHVARGLLHDPEVLFLDEPTIGLDPVGARELRATISSLTDAGKTILLTTHYMFEADALCDRIAVIIAGQDRRRGHPGTAEEPRRDGERRRGRGLRRRRGDGERLRGLERACSPCAVEEREQVQVLSVQTRRRRPADASILGHLNGTNVGRVSQREPTLEDAYVALVTEE